MATTASFGEYVENARAARERQATSTACEVPLQRRMSRLYSFVPEKYVSTVLTKIGMRSDASSTEGLELRENIEGPMSNQHRASVDLRRHSLVNADPTLTRTMSWWSTLYLLIASCDSNTASTIALSYPILGFGLAIGLNLVLCGASYFSSWSLWRMFEGLDSFRYPVKTYGDLAYRIYGKWSCRIIVTIQAMDLVFVTSGGILSCGYIFQWLVYEFGGRKLCHPISCLIVMIVMACLTEIRTLKSFSWVALGACLVTLIEFGIWLGTSDHVDASISNTTAIYGTSLGHVKHKFGYPGVGNLPRAGMVPQWVIGFTDVQTSYWGNIVFTEYMAEMRDVSDFGKPLKLAWLWILFQQILLGIVVYAQQGQYSGYDPFIFSFFSVDGRHKALSSMCAVLWILASLVSNALYANIALKVIFRSGIGKIGHNPAWILHRIKALWLIAGPLYWTFSFLVAMCLPLYIEVQGIYFCFGLLLGTYSLPALLYIGFRYKMRYMVPEITQNAAACRRRGVVDEPGIFAITRSNKGRLIIVLAVVAIVVGVVASALQLWVSIAEIKAQSSASFWRPYIMSCGI